jgi:CRP-like cAMP-binding protein
MPIQLETLRRIPFFSLFPDDIELREFLATGKWSKFTRGATIYRVGDPAQNIYVIAQGRACINRNKKNLGTLGPGDIFGEIAPLLDLHRTVNVVAAADTILFEFSLSALERVKLETRHTLLKHFYTVTTRRFVETTRKITGA